MRRNGWKVPNLQVRSNADSEIVATGLRGNVHELGQTLFLYGEFLWGLVFRAEKSLRVRTVLPRHCFTVEIESFGDHRHDRQFLY